MKTIYFYNSNNQLCGWIDLNLLPLDSNNDFSVTIKDKITYANSEEITKNDLPTIIIPALNHDDKKR